MGGESGIRCRDCGGNPVISLIIRLKQSIASYRQFGAVYRVKNPDKSPTNVVESENCHGYTHKTTPHL